MVDCDQHGLSDCNISALLTAVDTDSGKLGCKITVFDPDGNMSTEDKRCFLSLHVLIYGVIPYQYYFKVRPFLASREQTIRGATRESLVRISLGLFAHLVIDLRRSSIILLCLYTVTPLVSFMVALLAAW